MSDRAIGIDISHHQPPLDMQAIAEKFDFVIIRTSHGTWPDTRYQEHYRRAKEAGLPVGFYHYMYGEYTANAQALTFLRTIEDLECDLGTWLDVEDVKRVQARPEQIYTFLAKMYDSALRTGIYTSKYLWSYIVGNSQPGSLFPLYPEVIPDLWVANWNQPNEPYLPKHWNTYVFWQFTNSGSVPGYAGRIDTNYFNGTKEEMLAYFEIPNPLTDKEKLDILWEDFISRNEE
jgi:GH25 family lysozyme M1 (1,4-beta-N-acetylmuramidase)